MLFIRLGCRLYLLALVVVFDKLWYLIKSLFSILVILPLMIGVPGFRGLSTCFIGLIDLLLLDTVRNMFNIYCPFFLS